MHSHRSKPLRAIDLYSGVGGWSLGLKMAGIDVVSSYEYWPQANITNFKNNKHSSQTVNIRDLELKDLPSDIDIVVGSPPCTQFSFSNRGGSGNLDDGLEDIKKFLIIVNHLRPKHWVMENVPRVAAILEQEGKKGGRLEDFSHLNMVAKVFDMSLFGLPQRRRRCLAGNINFELLQTFASSAPKLSMAAVVEGLNTDPPTDCIYGLELSKSDLTDHEPEDFLNEEEERINRAAKTNHPVYNSMPFPDDMARPVRTITATCTRVSRESVVIEPPGHAGQYRRLTLRERSTLQGFPITFQFYGDSFGQKLRMVGNAVPPAFSYLVAHAMRGTVASELPRLSEAISTFDAPTVQPLRTPPDTPGKRYAWDRTFRFAIPSLRLKSGVRFELANIFEDQHPGWEVKFIFGNSKNIKSILLNIELITHIYNKYGSTFPISAISELQRINAYVEAIDTAHMQDVWSHTGPGATRPFMLLDRLDEAGETLVKCLAAMPELAEALVREALAFEYGAGVQGLPGTAKLTKNAGLIASGLLIGSTVNAKLRQRPRPRTAQPRLRAL